MSRARTILVAGVVCATAAAAFIGWSVARPSSHPQRADSSTSTPTGVPSAPSSASNSDSTANEVSKLGSIPLAQPGSEISVGLPATLRLEDFDGQVIYATVTMSEIQELPADESANLIAKIPSLAGYSTVYEMPVSLTVLGIVTNGGSDVATRVTGLTAKSLGGFTIAPHQGSDPLPVSNTLSDGSCQGLTPALPASVGQTLQWCIHAFGQTGGPAPAGGQYQTPSGPYQSPIFWASQTFGSTVTIP